MRTFLFFLAITLAGCSADRKASPGPGVSLLIVGDSLTAGYGISNPEEKAWPALLEKRWKSEGFLGSDQSVVNAGISGDTTQGGSSRLPTLLEQHNPKVVAIALGANDVRRQGRASQIQANLDQMVRASQASGAKVILIGVELPAALSFAASGEPNRSVREVARKHGLEMTSIPLNVVSRKKMMLDDQIHPNGQAQEIIAQALREDLEKVMSQ